LGISSDTELDELRFENNPLVNFLEDGQTHIRKNTKQCKKKRKKSHTYHQHTTIQL